MKRESGFYPYPRLQTQRILPRESLARISHEISPTNAVFIFAPGLAESHRSAPLLSKLAEKYTVFGFINTPPEGRRVPKEDPEVLKAQRFAVSLQELKAQGIERVNLILHSEGGVYGTLAAKMATENPTDFPTIDRLILINPAGIIKQNPLDVGIRFAASAWDWRYKEVREAIHTDRDVRRRSFMSFPPRPVVVTKELVSIAQTNVVPLLQELQQKGIKVDVISATEDMVFPYKKMREAVKKAGIPLTTLSGPHQAIQMPSHSREYADEMGKLIN